jgi:hypothetical protein
MEEGYTQLGTVLTDQRQANSEGDGVIVVGRFKGDPYDGVQLSSTLAGLLDGVRGQDTDGVDRQSVQVYPGSCQRVGRHPHFLVPRCAGR